jgi:uncharacterized membrane protein YjjP (DUF1212 family)
MQVVKIIRTVDITELTETDDQFIVRDLVDGKYYIGDGSDVLVEITTDNSNKWAKIFFYGGD